MDLKDCLAFCIKEDEDRSLGVTEQDITYAYGMSKMTVVAEVPQYAAYMKMEFVEFLEFIGRIASAKYRHSPETA